MSVWRQQPSQGSARWISREFAELLADPGKCQATPDGIEPAFDVIIVGSGYGAAIAAAELAGSGLTVCVLERGREFLPGAFPSQLSELPTQVRGSFAGRTRGGEGLFDLRVGGDVSVVLANGLGGGSLINAGVMEIPRDEVFTQRRTTADGIGDPVWPAFWRDREQRLALYADAKRLLGAADRVGDRDEDNSIERHPLHQAEPLKKTEVLRRMAPSGSFRHAAITVAMQDKVTVGGVQLQACKLCGDCATGCNYGAKESLDTNLLAAAHRQGVQIYCGATVLRLQRPSGRLDRWALCVTHTDADLRQREGGARWIAARRVILAAGSLGSTEILLRSQRAAPELWFSGLLGQRFSTNGDMIAFGHDYGPRAQANAVVDEDQLPGERHVGPTITGVIDAVAEEKDSGIRRPIVIEELAVPGALRRLTGESVATAETLHALGDFNRGSHAEGHPADDPYAVHPQKLTNLSIFAAMGDDGAAGSLRLGAEGERDESDGHLSVVWPGVTRLPLFDAQIDRLEALAKDAKFGGRTLANPMWRLLPPGMDFLIGNQRGPLLTVHPLGGCAIGESVVKGVVNEYGEVFDPMAADGGLHEGLVVLDGSIVPSALGTNPALTIAAVALRAARRLRREWSKSVAPSMPRQWPPLPRPAVADIEAEIAARPPREQHGTVAGVTERLSGPLRLRDARGREQRCHVELTLTYDPLRLQQLFVPDEQGRLSGACVTVGNTPQSSGLLRIFLQSEWEQLQASGWTGARRHEAEQRLARSYALSGSLTILRREASGLCGRSWRAAKAWAVNRGARDIYQTALEGLRGTGHGGGPGFFARVWNLLQLASHAGEVRRFDYELTVGAESEESLAAPLAGRFEAPSLRGLPIRGRKRITYARPSNPWRQLMELGLDDLAGLMRGQERLLTLEPRYLAASGQPLLRIESQRDHVEALADFASLGGYFLRMMLSIHIWNARKPDRPRDRPVQRLPGRIRGLPPPEVQQIEVDRIGGKPVLMQLTRYRAKAHPAGRPVLLIHGYSASGTTFAHPALKPGLAPMLAHAGRDVWVADLRSSAGMPMATYPWTFERVALADIPAAIDHIWWRSGEQRIDVVAHCMGAVMLSMAVLSAGKTPQEIDELLRSRDPADSELPIDRFRGERRALTGRIGRIVLSQNGPAMVMSQQNIFRAYLMSYLEQLFGPLPYHFRPEPGEGLAGELLDRLLGTLPYPDEDLLIENPWRFWRRTEFITSRHRMDALYGRTFSLRNLSREVLDHIDDLFGPLSLDTVAQVIHFARHQVITSRGGYNRFVSGDALARDWPFPTLSIHGEENGLADVETLARIGAITAGLGERFERWRIDGTGHQDSLIGRDSPRVFRRILEFLDRPVAPAPPDPAPPHFVADPPWLGPMLNLACGLPAAAPTISLGASPQLGRPQAVSCWPGDAARAWSEAELARLGIDAAQTLVAIDAQTDTDWFVLSLPDWVARVEVQHLHLLLIYPQPDAMPAPGFAMAKSALATDAGIGARASRQAAMLEAVRQRLFLETGAEGVSDGPLHLVWKKPLPPDRPLRLALGSCQYPAGILNELPARRSWERLDAALLSAEAPELLLLTGDQIYADATGGLFDPTLADDRYRKPYETWLHNPAVRRVLGRLPVLTMLDDHEIDDNWEPIPGMPGDKAYDLNQRLLAQGVAAFRRFQRGGQSPAQPLYGAVESLPLPLFLLDTRTQRDARRASTLDSASLLGDAQDAALRRWLLAQPRELPKLIVSPGILLPRHRWALRAELAEGVEETGDGAALASDSWDGYPQTLYSLLAFIAENDLRGVVFLSGDEHRGLCASARIRGEGHAVTVHSVHTPGLNTPYRFANARDADFVAEERIDFERIADDGQRSEWHCEVKTRVFEGAGFTQLRLQHESGAWVLHCEFDSDEQIPLAQRRWSVVLDGT
jgi:cholesterol oxidase